MNSIIYSPYIFLYNTQLLIPLVCRLPDSMHSWFLVAHLHMWLLMVRLKREGEDGHFLTKQLVGMFWEDVKQRPKALGVR